jgi:transposase InsO family protein
VEEESTFGSDPLLRPRITVYGPLLRRAPEGGSGIFPSMGRVGSALENAMAESFVSTLKAEMGTVLFDTRETARRAHFDYIEGFYNPTRRHSSIGYMSPSEYELAIAEEVRVA